MSIQVLIIGLGQFGMSLARTLSEKGTEVIAVDQDKELVDEAAGFLDDALCLDATDETALGKLCPKERDVVICAIGGREPSILTTAISLGMSFLKNTSKSKSQFNKINIIICISAILFSKIGFSKLVTLLYPILGGIGLIQILQILLKKCCKKG